MVYLLGGLFTGIPITITQLIGNNSKFFEPGGVTMNGL